MLFFDKIGACLVLVTGLSLFLSFEFSSGVFLFLVNYFSLRIIVNSMFYKTDLDSLTTVNKYFFIPAMLIKLLAIGGITYLVLVIFKGNAYEYIGGFGLGLAIFAVGHFLTGATPGRSDPKNNGVG